MPTFRRLVVLVIALALMLPAAVAAQTSTIPPSGSGDLSDEPPVDLDGGSDGGDPGRDRNGGSQGDDGRGSGDRNGTGSGRAGGEELPNTGTDPRVLFLAGAALVLVGLGLRLRTADADHY